VTTEPEGGDRVDAVFAALSDPTRREVVARLADGESTATELAGGLPVSRQAVAKHLAVLGEAELVESRREGREKRYRLTPQPLTEAMGWMVSVGAEWDRRLERLHDLLGE
jgi:DNA-binding transcriptional ArsR family regulator